jgi:hypothetical protein
MIQRIKNWARPPQIVDFAVHEEWLSSVIEANKCALGHQDEALEWMDDAINDWHLDSLGIVKLDESVLEKAYQKHREDVRR